METLENRLVLSTFTVTNALDSGAGSLRWAIEEANASAGRDEIGFDIAGPGPHSIQPLSALPLITDRVTIDGTTQPGFAGTPIIDLDGSLAGDEVDGLRITAGNSTVRGLVINRFAGSGIVLDGDGPCGGGGLVPPGSNRVQGNYIGTDVTGANALPNAKYGVAVINGSMFNLVGPHGNELDDAAKGNVISGNALGGVYFGDLTGFNTVGGNFIGTDASGTLALGNGGDGIHVDGSRCNRIGTRGDGLADEAQRNVISGNAGQGVRISGEDSYSNVVATNYLGTDVTGTVALGNGDCGVLIEEGSAGNRIGTNGDGISDAAERNLISGNGGNGLVIRGAGTDSNVFAGNYIGTDAAGLNALGNRQHGVLIHNRGEGGPQHNLIGTNGDGVGDEAERNVISANSSYGVVIWGDGTDHNIVAGNFIGTDVTGLNALPNLRHGVAAWSGAQGNQIGGSAALANTIAYNEGVGAAIIGEDTTGNAIRANSIYANGGLGIDLGDDGVTANDPGDADTGPNHLQNYPVITTVLVGTATRVVGNLNSTPNTEFTLDFYANTAADPSGYGEGERWLGSAVLTTDASGDADFDLLFPPAMTAGELVTATATDPEGNTSEFSQAVVAEHDDADGSPATPLTSLRITEINYNPYEPTADELAKNPSLGSDDFEFIELQNVGQRTIDLTGVRFAAGISFDFTGSEVTELAPGQTVLVVANREAVQVRYIGPQDVYPPIYPPMAGEFSGRLSNDGEQIVLVDSAGNTIHDFTYDDSGDWPTSADGDGDTLEVVDVTGDYSDPANWTASDQTGGTPFWGTNQTIHVSEVLGPITFLEINDLDPSGGDLWYEFSATRDALMTVDARFDGPADAVQLTLYDENLVELAQSTGSDGNQRIDYPAGPGDTFHLEVSGTSTDVDLRLANLVHTQGTRVNVYGTDGEDEFKFNAAASRLVDVYTICWEDEFEFDPPTFRLVTVNGVEYDFDDAALTSATFDGGPGTDVFTFRGSDATEWVKMWPGRAIVTGPNYIVTTTSTENATAYANGGVDVALLFDSLGADYFQVFLGGGQMSGVGFNNTAWGFDYLHGYASDDGQTDSAHFTPPFAPCSDSLVGSGAGPELFRAWPAQACLIANGYYTRAKGFDQVHAQASVSNAVALIVDSPGPDVFDAYADQTLMTYADGKTVQTDNFRYVHAYASPGAVDTANLYDTTAGGWASYNTTFDARVAADGRHWSRMFAGGVGAFYNRVLGFELTRAVCEPGGSDVALLFDSPGADVFEAYADRGTLTYADGTVVEAQDFRYLHAVARNGGPDSATLYDQTTTGTRYATTLLDYAGSSILYTGYHSGAVRVWDFDETRAALGGGDDRVRLFDDPDRVDHLVVPFPGDAGHAPAKAKFSNDRRQLYIDDFVWLWATTSEDFEDEADVDPAYADQVILDGNWVEL